jgi:hypothetical protein
MSPYKTGGTPITGYIIEKTEIISTIEKQNKKSMEESYKITSKWILHDSVDRYTLDYKLKNLKVGALYSIRVAAVNLSGTGKFIEIAEPIIAKNLHTKPEPPIGPIEFSNMTRETVDIAWHHPKNHGSSPVHSYFIEKRDIKDKIWIKIARIDPDIRVLKIFNLVEGNEYIFRVSAENEYGISDSLESDKFKPSRNYEALPSSSRPWINLTNAKPYIDEIYITQELTREEYFFRIYAENLLSTVWESINFAELFNSKF